MNVTKIANEHIEQVESTIDPDIVLQLISGFKRFVLAAAESVQNALAWRVPEKDPEILVHVFREGPETCLEIIDQGRGVSQAGRAALTSLGKSLARGQKGMRGKNGSGSKAWFWHAARTTIETVPEDGRLYRITFSPGQFFQWLFPNKDTKAAAGVWEVSAKPTTHPVRLTGTRIIFHGLGKGDGTLHRGKPLVDPKEVRTPERLIDELAEFLPPNADRFIQIVSGGKVHRLKVRKIDGRPIIGEKNDVPNVGTVAWSMAFVDRARKGVDKFTIGAVGNKVEWNEFVRLIKNGDRSFAPLIEQLDEFGDPLLSGHIEIGALEDYRGLYSNSMESGVAQDIPLVEGILLAAVTFILPDVQAASRGSQTGIKEDHKAFAADLAQLFKAASGETNPVEPSGARDPGSSGQTRTVLERGEKRTFPVPANCTTGVVWDASRSGGTVADCNARQAAYTAGTKEGKDFVLVARLANDPSVTVCEISIEVIAEFPFEFDRRTYPVEPGSRVRLAIDQRAMRRAGSDIVIRVAKNQKSGYPSDLRLVHTQGTAYAEAIAGTATGYVAVEATRGNEVLATTTVLVRPKTRTEEKKTLDLSFAWGGHLYELMVQHYGNGNVDLGQVSYVIPGEKRSTIVLILSHPLFEESGSRRQAALWQIAVRIAEREHPSASVDEATQNAGRVYGALVKPR